MKTNVGYVDRALRIAIGLSLMVAAGIGFIGPWGWIGIVPLATGLFRFCPAYLIFGIRTCEAESK